MRVAFHTDQLWFSAPGGIGTYVRELAPALASLGDAPELTTFQVGSAGDRLDLPAGTRHAATVGPAGCECLEAWGA